MKGALGEQFVEHTPGAVQVGSGIDHLAASLFGDGYCAVPITVLAAVIVDVSRPVRGQCRSPSP